MVGQNLNLIKILDPDSVAVRIEHGTMRYVHRIRNYFKSSIFNQKLIIPGTNLERISMTISIFTIVIVILQVIQEVLRVTSTDQKCTGESTYVSTYASTYASTHAIFDMMVQVLNIL